MTWIKKVQVVASIIKVDLLIFMKIKAIALYIINFVEIAYHQHEVLHIIKSQEDTPCGDDIRLTVVIYTLRW